MGLRQCTLKNALKDNDKFYQKAALFLWIAFTVFLLVRAFLGPMWYAEIDSNALPLISLQYRGSFLMNEGDLLQAQIDFPSLYAGINTFDDLRSTKLLETSAGWLSFYFPIYPIFCLPVKLLLGAFQVNQERCFFITNALLISSALWVVHRKLNVTPKQRLIALVLLIISPIIYYNNYLNYEAFVFSLLTVSLVLYYNKSYKISAFLLALAGMSNSTVMAVGIVMIGEYFVKIIYRGRGTPFISLIKDNLKETIKYGLCFVPCLIPLIQQEIYLGHNTFISNAATVENIGARFFMYLFDPTLGFSTFAPIAVLLFFAVVVIALHRKELRSIPWLLFLVGTVAAFSLTVHINCGMIYCSRYLVWTYPIIPLFLATIGFHHISSILWSRVLYFAVAVSSGLLLFINHSTALNPHVFNPTTEWLLEQAPALYNPYSATFYCRTLHEDGAYWHTEPAYYLSPKTDQVRKLIFKADPGQAEIILNDLIGDDAAMEHLRTQLYDVKNDGKYHYLNFPSWGEHQLREKLLEEKEMLQAGNVLVAMEDIKLLGGASYQSFGEQITILENTIYKIELELPKDFDFSVPENFFVDFYAEDYDSAEQEANSFLIKGRYDYTFYFDSGSFDSDTKNVIVRIISFPGDKQQTGTTIERFSVTEMIYTQ